MTNIILTHLLRSDEAKEILAYARQERIPLNVIFSQHRYANAVFKPGFRHIMGSSGMLRLMIPHTDSRIYTFLIRENDFPLLSLRFDYKFMVWSSGRLVR